MDNLNRRNTETVEQVIKEQNRKLEAQEIRINGLNAGLSSMQERLNALESMLINQKVQLTGHGSSVKEPLSLSHYVVEDNK
jgi:uncharacterized coiled-coil protein SlyX